jgi:FkbH-like protein
MRDALHYPLDVPALLRRRKALKRELKGLPGPFVDKKIALLGGSTTADLRELLELFLLDAGIRPTLWESDYNRFWEDAAVDDHELRAFGPDVVIVHTTHHNLLQWPKAGASDAEADAVLAAEVDRFKTMWRRLLEGTTCVVVQNNVDPPPLEPLGHLGVTARFGHTRHVDRLNAAFAEAAEAEPRLCLNDIARLAARLGLEHWSDPRDWLAWKMAVTPAAAVALAQQTARIVRSIFGKTKKCLVLDLDNTLWGGVIGDDGVRGLRLGHETPEGEAFVAFQRYCLCLKERGVLLAVASKNDPDAAAEGFSHPDTVLKRDDFSAFHASWADKPKSLRAIAQELNLGLDSLVFVDDNPFERELVARSLPEVAVVNAGEVTRFAEAIDREGYFDPFSLTAADAARASQYAANGRRAAAEAEFESYDAYLGSLEMRAKIAPFQEVYLDRIAQLTNKTNQFNLTTRRYTLGELSSIAKNPEYVTLYGRLADRFGDNGLVSVIIGRAYGDALHLDLWLMSCRVLKRTFEHAMFEALCEAAAARGLTTLVGTYLPTPKNAMVASLYASLGFHRADEAQSRWLFTLGRDAAPSTPHIRRI